jgi:hypothetical protein
VQISGALIGIVVPFLPPVSLKFPNVPELAHDVGFRPIPAVSLRVCRHGPL